MKRSFDPRLTKVSRLSEDLKIEIEITDRTLFLVFRKLYLSGSREIGDWIEETDWWKFLKWEYLQKKKKEEEGERKKKKRNRGGIDNTWS